MPNWNRVEPRKLEALVAVLRHGSTAQAAKMLATSQPNVSKMIRGLEESLGVTLFSRDRGRLRPTVEALKIGELAEHTLNSLDDIIAEAAHGSRSGGGTLRIGALPTFAGYLLPKTIAELAEAMPNVDIYASVFPHGTLHNRLREGDLDCAIVHFPKDETDIGATVVGAAPLVAVMRKDHPLAMQATIIPEDLEHQQLITFPARLAFARIIRNLIGNGPNTRRIQTNYTFLALNIVKESGGVAIVDPFHFGSSEEAAGLCIRPLSNTAEISIGLIFSTARGRPDLLEMVEHIFSKEVRRFQARFDKLTSM